MTKRVRNDRQMTQQSWDCVELTRKKWCFWRNKQEKNSTQKTRNKQLIIPWKVWQSTTKKPGDSSIFSINQSINQFIHLHDRHILAIFTCHTCHRCILEDTRHTHNIYLSHLSPMYPGRHASHTKSSLWAVGTHVGLKLKHTNKMITTTVNSTWQPTENILRYSDNWVLLTAHPSLSFILPYW